ncbi:MAG TPA: protein-glutamate O-methyltransferase CheR [Rectinemataceae bacterium]|nr:protein-glutamate O-methyltransferase CheR [Rectinemataceae bacterium]
MQGIEGLPEIREADYRFVADLLYERFGIQFGDRKKVLVAGRLAKRLRELGLSNFADYVKLLRNDSSGVELVEFVNRLTTNHSFFFRENEHFDYLKREIVPPLIHEASRGRGTSLRIWSAGCAAGEEAHTIAITLRESLGEAFRLLDPSILATDISLSALKDASVGVYPANRFSEMPKVFQTRYFEKLEDEHWKALPSIHEFILFKRLNLMSIPYPFKGLFDVVFCRNVMIYFDHEARSKLVKAIYDFVKPGGYFFIGHSETLQRNDCPFVYVKPAIYRKEIGP